MGRRILILTASPVRDLLIDLTIADKLKALGNEVWVRPCLREGRKSVLELQPDIVVVPPVRNPYSRDFVETLKSWGCGVVSRHTEASCDWSDFKKMSDREKQSILGNIPYKVDTELVWGSDEAEILNRRNAPFKAMAVGSFACDVFLNEYKNKVTLREAFNQKYGFDNNKKNLLIGSPWGFCDSAPDLRIDEVDAIKKDIEGRAKYIEMIKKVNDPVIKEKFNILLTVHPGVGIDYYKQELNGIVPIDSESSALELIANCDCLVHSGSTMAIQAHLLNIPAFQYGDVNSKVMNWFAQPESPLSQVSPKANSITDLMNWILNSEINSNANLETLKTLENGRYGLMDGKASERAAEIINGIAGQFKMCWPKAHRDYDQLTIMKEASRAIHYGFCNICGNSFAIIKQEWLNQLSNALKLPRPIPEVIMPFGQACPHCGTRVLDVYSSGNTGEIELNKTAPKNTSAN